MKDLISRVVADRERDIILALKQCMNDRLQRIHTKETKMLEEIGTSTFPQIPKNGRQRKLTCSSRAP